MAETKRIVPKYSMQYWLQFDDGKALKVEETTERTLEAEANDYEPEYLETRISPKYRLSTSRTFTFTKDLTIPEELSKRLVALEDAENTPVTLIRTLNYDVAAGTPAPETALIAKQAKGALNIDPIADGDVLQMTGSVAIQSEWVHGKFNATTQAFTPDTTKASR